MDELKIAVIIGLTILLLSALIYRFGMSGSSPRIVLFYADWCPACKSFKPEWTKTQDELGSSVDFENVDISDKELMSSKTKQYGVEVPTIPTILIVEGKNVEKYEGPRNAKDLAKYIKDKL